MRWVALGLLLLFLLVEGFLLLRVWARPES